MSALDPMGGWGGIDIQPMSGVWLDQGSVLTSFVLNQRELGEKKQVVGRETVDVFGIERTVETVEDIPAMWHCYFLHDG